MIHAHLGTWIVATVLSQNAGESEVLDMDDEIDAIFDEVKEKFRDEKLMQTIAVENVFYKMWKREE